MIDMTSKYTVTMSNHCLLEKKCLRLALKYELGLSCMCIRVAALVYLTFGTSLTLTKLIYIYCSPLLKSLPCTSHDAGREKLWNTGPVSEYEIQSAIIPFVGIIIIQKEYEV
jgi:hypothetical protein